MKKIVIVAVVAWFITTSFSFIYADTSSESFLGRLIWKQEALKGMAFTPQDVGSGTSADKFLARLVKKHAQLKTMAVSSKIFVGMDSKGLSSNLKYVLRLQNIPETLVSAR